MDGEDIHKKGLYKWKRQENPRTYSRAKNVTSATDIENWIEKVEIASTHAAEQVFGNVPSTSKGRSYGRAVARATKEYAKDDDQAHSEAQELLSQWMKEKVDLNGGLDAEMDCHYVDDGWERHELQSEVKKEWDNMLAVNNEEYGLTETPQKYATDRYNLDEEDELASVMKNMLNKQVVKKTFKKDLGLHKWCDFEDPRNKMELRRQQVRENRKKHEDELRWKREERQNRKMIQSAAQQLVMKEERTKLQMAKREEMLIHQEMIKMRKEMQDERIKNEERKKREKVNNEELLLAAKLKIAWDEENEHEEELESQRKYEARQRHLQQHIRELEARQLSNNRQMLHRHFSAWYKLVLDRRLKIGKQRALHDWRLLLRTWNAWRAYVRTGTMARETKQHQEEVISTQRKQLTADRHSRLTTLRKYFVAWQVYVHSEQDRRELEHAQHSTRSKMASLLEAAASGKLFSATDTPASTARSNTSRARSPACATTNSGTESKIRIGEKPSTADKIYSLFENTRTLAPHTESMSTERSDTPSPPPGAQKNRRLPKDAWQVTRRHLDLTLEEIASLPGSELMCSPEQMDQKILKKYGRQPWHKVEVSSYEHRHSAQQKILKEQKQQIQEQQRLIEDLKFENTQKELVKQLKEQKLVLKQMQEKGNKAVQLYDATSQSAGNKTATSNSKSKRCVSASLKGCASVSPKGCASASPKGCVDRDGSPRAHTSHKQAIKSRAHSAGAAAPPTNFLQIDTRRAKSAKQDSWSPSVSPSTVGSDPDSPGRPGSGKLWIGSVVMKRPASPMIQSHREDASAILGVKDTARSETSQASKQSSNSSSAMQKNRYVEVLKNMEERAAERARSKKLREEKRRQAEQARLDELEAVAAAHKAKEEADKKKRVKAYREKKEEEKLKEMERQLEEAKLRQQTDLADQHYLKSLMKYRGIVPLRKLVEEAREREEIAIHHYEHCLQRKVLLSWHHTVKEEWRDKEALATQMSNFLCIKHTFQNWRLFKHHMIIEEHKAIKHYQRNMKARLFQVWRDYAIEEKVASWEKERMARQNYKRLLLRRHFAAWKRLPLEAIKEKERERRRAELRQKVASLIPDFQTSQSLSESSDFKTK